MKNSIEPTATPARVTRGLRQIRYTQLAAARAIGQSPALVSMVLRGKVKSQRCLDKLAQLIKQTGGDA
jgi:predicted transcriptional regulator